MFESHHIWAWMAVGVHGHGHQVVWEWQGLWGCGVESQDGEIGWELGEMRLGPVG